MKEATGELNMTVITVVAITAVAALFYAFVWPAVQQGIADNTCKAFGSGWHAIKNTTTTTSTDSTTANKYCCCPSDVTGTCNKTKCSNTD